MNTHKHSLRFALLCFFPLLFQILADGQTYTQEEVAKLTKNPRYAKQGEKTQGFQVIVRGLKSLGYVEDCPIVDQQYPTKKKKNKKALIRLTDFCFPFGGRRCGGNCPPAAGGGTAAGINTGNHHHKEEATAAAVVMEEV